MHDLADLGIQTSKRVRVYSGSLKLGKKINPEIWGSPGSCQLLCLQQFPKILKKFGTPPFFFELVSSLLVFSLLFFGLWILKCLPGILVAINHGFSSFKWSKESHLELLFLALQIPSKFSYIGRFFIWLFRRCGYSSALSFLFRPAVAGDFRNLVVFSAPPLRVFFRSPLSFYADCARIGVFVPPLWVVDFSGMLRVPLNSRLVLSSPPLRELFKSRLVLSLRLFVSRRLLRR